LVPVDGLAQCRPFAVNFESGHGDGVFKEGRRIDLYRLVVIVQRFWVEDVRALKVTLLAWLQDARVNRRL
jgi:hypothetical protein